MADINRISSPVTIFQEDLYKSPIKSEKMKEMLCKEAKSPALFLIGSIEKVNQKVLNLELELERCRDVLVIESRQEEDEEKHQPGPSPWGADSDIDKKELKIFSQKYAKRAMQMLNLESRFYGTRSTRQRIEVKPKLVELQQFPGINKHDVTPLPNNTSLDNVIEKVILAQKDLKRKHHYHKEFCNLFNFPTVRAILLDAFWWIFLYKYQPDLASQNFLFDRIAENYIQLMTDCRSIQCGEVFLKALPGILCQGVYSCFCCSFPQSGLQFDSDDFKRDLCNTLHEWIGGIRPSLGIYRKWEYSTLEPQGMRKELMPTKDKRKKGLTLSFQPTEKAISSLVPLIDDPKSHRTQRLRSISQTKMHSKNLDHYSRIPDEVSLYQTTVTQSCPSLELPEYSSKENITASEAQTMQGKLNQVQHSMTEVAESKQDSSNTLQSRKEVPKPGSTANIKESHPACCGPEFIQNIFNLTGHSPLVQHYLQKRNVETKVGQNIYLPRTEIKKQIPPGIPTYRDVIHEGYRHIHKLDSANKAWYRYHRKEVVKFNCKQLEDRKSFQRNQEKLLSNHQEVKRLSQLLFPSPKEKEKESENEVNETIEASTTAKNRKKLE